jgi:hypothetical protein
MSGRLSASAGVSEMALHTIKTVRTPMKINRFVFFFFIIFSLLVCGKGLTF